MSKSLKLHGGVLNVFDTSPPFTNQAYYFQALWDPTYADPRGRSFYVSVNYSFKEGAERGLAVMRARQPNCGKPS